MDRHPNAVLTPRGRADIFLAVEAGMTVSAACLGAGISRRSYYRWLPRWRARGRDGLVDRSSRPHHSPRRLSLEQEVRIIAVRLLLGWGPDRIAAIVGLPASSCHRVLRRGGLVHTKAAPEPVVRYEHEHPGDLIHLDTKRLRRIMDGPGHRATGNRKGRRSGAGREVLHVAIDDATRLVHASDPGRREEGHHRTLHHPGPALVP